MQTEGRLRTFQGGKGKNTPERPRFFIERKSLLEYFKAQEMDE